MLLMGAHSLVTDIGELNPESLFVWESNTVADAQPDICTGLLHFVITEALRALLLSFIHKQMLSIFYFLSAYDINCCLHQDSVSSLLLLVE